MNRFTNLFFFTFLIFAASSAWPEDADTAVVLIDMQSGFVAPHPQSTPALKATDALIAKQIKLLDWAERRDIPVLVFEFSAMGDTLSPLKQAIARRHLKHFAYVEKDQDDGFALRSTSQRQAQMILQTWGVSSLVVAGVNGSLCVRQTVQGALAAGFQVFTSADLVGDYCSLVWPVYPDDRWWSRIRNGLFHPYEDLTALQNCSALLQP